LPIDPHPLETTDPKLLNEMLIKRSKLNLRWKDSPMSLLRRLDHPLPERMVTELETIEDLELIDLDERETEKTEDPELIDPLESHERVENNELENLDLLVREENPEKTEDPELIDPPERDEKTEVPRRDNPEETETRRNTFEITKMLLMMERPTSEPMIGSLELAGIPEKTRREVLEVPTGDL